MDDRQRFGQILKGLQQSYFTLNPTYFMRALDEHIDLLTYVDTVDNNKVTLLDLVLLLKDESAGNQSRRRFYSLAQKLETILRERGAYTFTNRPKKTRRGAMTAKDASALAAKASNLRAFTNKAAREAKPPRFRSTTNKRNFSKGIASKTRKRRN